MAEVIEQLIVQFGTSGQDDIIKAFGAVGRAAEDAGKQVAEAFGGPQAATLAALGIGIAGAAAGFGVLVRSASEAANQIGEFATQTGESVGAVSTLEQGIARMGGSLDGVQGAFRRMATVAERAWAEVKRESQTARDKQIDDALAVADANENVFKARQKFAEQMQALGRPTGVAPVSPIVQQQHEIREAQLEFQKVQQAANEAQKKADMDRLNDIRNIAAAVESVVKGEQSVAEASKTANLEVQNVVKGLAAGAAPGAVEALKNFSGNLNELAGMDPKVQTLFLHLADFMKNSHDATLNAAVASTYFGRTLANDLIPQMTRLGSEGFLAAGEAAKQFGFVLDENARKAGEAFHTSFNRLTNDLVSMKNEFGGAFAPSFTEGMTSLSHMLDENNKRFEAWSQNLATRAKPAIDQFFAALRALAASIGNLKLDPGDDAAAKWKRFTDVTVGALKIFVHELEEALHAIYALAKAMTELGTGHPLAALDTIGEEFKRKILDTIATVKRAGRIFEEAGKGGEVGPAPPQGAPGRPTPEMTAADAAERQRVITQRQQQMAQERLAQGLTPAGPALGRAYAELAERTDRQLGRGVSTGPNTTVQALDRNTASTDRNTASTDKQTAGRMPPGSFQAPPPGVGVIPPGSATPAGPAFRVQSAWDALLTGGGMLPAIGSRLGLGPGPAGPAERAGPGVGTAAYDRLESAALKLLAAGDKQLQAATKTEPGAAAGGGEQGGALADLLAGKIGSAISDVLQGIQARQGAGTPSAEAQSGMPGMSMQDLQEAQDNITSQLNAAAEAARSFASTVANILTHVPAPGSVMQSGGEVTGGLPGRDSVHIMGMPGEFMMSEPATRFYGTGVMHLINKMKLPKPHISHLMEGGLVVAPQTVHYMQHGGGITSAMTMPMVTGPSSTRTVGGGGAAHATSPAGRPLTIYFGGEAVHGFTATEQAATQTARIAVNRAVRSGGTKPQWYVAS